MIVFSKKLVIGIHQFALSDGRRRLLRGNIGRPAFQSELSDSHADGAGGDQNDLISRIFEIAHDPAQLLHTADIQKPRFIGKR